MGRFYLRVDGFVQNRFESAVIREKKNTRNFTKSLIFTNTHKRETVKQRYLGLPCRYDFHRPCRGLKLLNLYISCLICLSTGFYSSDYLIERLVLTAVKCCRSRHNADISWTPVNTNQSELNSTIAVNMATLLNRPARRPEEVIIVIIVVTTTRCKFFFP